MIRRERLRWMLAPMVGALAGCAVVKIDVDVYKGPLANQERVQLHELAIAPKAVHPLLVGLCWTLERELPPGTLMGSECPDHPGNPVSTTTKLTSDDDIREAVELQSRVVKVLLLYCGDLKEEEEGRDISDWCKKTVASGRSTASYFGKTVTYVVPRRGILASVRPILIGYKDDNDCFRRDGSDTLSDTIPWRPCVADALDALVHFAEQIVVLANNQPLLDNPPTKLQKIAGAFSEDVLENGPHDQFIRVLQGIGNSILVQVDELRERNQHLTYLKKRAQSERDSLKLALKRGPGQALDQLVRDLRAERTKADAEAVGADALPSEAELAAGSKKAKDDLTKAEGALGTANALSRLLSGRAVGVSAAELGTLKAAAGGDAMATGKVVADAIVAWLDGKIEAEPRRPRDPRRLEQFKLAKQYLADNRITLDALPSTSRSSQLAAILAIADQSVEDDRAEVEAEKQAKQAADAAQANAKRKREAQTVKARDDIAIKEIESRLQKVLSEADGIPPPTDATAAFDRMRTLLATDASKETVQEKKNNLAIAIKVLSTRVPSLPSEVAAIANSPKDGEESARDVLDRLIASLRYERILAARDNDEIRMSSLDAALKVAYNDRADMAYLRPASAYLRSSYPATSLQDNPGLGWRNMLGDHSLRTAPFAPEIGDILNGDRARINTQIDKQFWQNINSVRVAGGGNTNYAIAKDDIGNWYVKAYSADEKPIIQAAKSLALYNIGAGLNTNLLSSPATTTNLPGGLANHPGTANPTGQNPTGQTTTNGQGTTLDRIFDKYNQNFQTTTKAAYDQLTGTSTADDLRNRVTKAWNDNTDVKALNLSPSLLDPATTDLRTAIANLKQADDAAAAKSPGNVDQGATIVSVLDAMRRFHNAARQAVLDQHVTDDPKAKLAVAEAAKAKAEKDLADATAQLSDAKLAEAKAQARRDAATDQAAITQADKDLADAKATTNQRQQAVTDKSSTADQATKDDDKAAATLKKATDGQAAALAAVTRVVRDTIDPAIKARLAAVKEFETSILVIGGATSPQQ